jgi:hypothetical protein
MAKRWGSYTPSGRISLNPELVKVPTECIDCVILHELCHVKHRSHDRHFYKLLHRVAPDWLRLKYKRGGGFLRKRSIPMKLPRFKTIRVHRAAFVVGLNPAFEILSQANVIPLGLDF